MEATEPFKRTGTDTLVVREGGGCLGLFGLPFFAAGIFLTLVGIQVLPLQNAGEVPFWAWPLIALMGLVFTAAGGGIAFGRRWIILDRSRGSVLRQWGLLVPMRRQEQMLSDYHAVALRLQAGDSESVDRYPVVLKARNWQSDLSLSSPADYGAARRQAVCAAGFLQLPLVDDSSEHPVRIDPAAAGDTLRERLARREDIAHLARPFTMKSEVRESDGRVTITIPGPGFKRRNLVGAVIPVVILVFAVTSLDGFFRQTGTPLFVRVAALAFIILFFVVAPLLGFVHSTLAAVRGYTRITAGPDGLEILERGARRTKTTRLPAAEILDLDYSTAEARLNLRPSCAARMDPVEALRRWRPPAAPWNESWWQRKLRDVIRSQGVVVKAETGVYTYAAGFADDEVRYLYAVVKAALMRG